MEAVIEEAQAEDRHDRSRRQTGRATSKGHPPECRDQPSEHFPPNDATAPTNESADARAMQTADTADGLDVPEDLQAFQDPRKAEMIMRCRTWRGADRSRSKAPQQLAAEAPLPGRLVDAIVEARSITAWGPASGNSNMSAG